MPTNPFYERVPSNPNLLDNWYFLHPVNQRGTLEYSSPGYTIDRWKSDGGTVSLTSSGLHFVSMTDAFYQFIEAGTTNQLLGKTLTASVLLADNTLEYGTVTIPNAFYESPVFYRFSPHIEFVLMGESDGTAQGTRLSNLVGKTVVACKLELGSTQTLAHKDGEKWVLNDPPPNYQQELAKCKRYMRVFKGDHKDGLQTVGVGTVFGSSFCVFLPIDGMRAYPALITNGSFNINITGVVLFNASSVVTQLANSSKAYLCVCGILTTDASTYRGMFATFTLTQGSTIILDANL